MKPTKEDLRVAKDVAACANLEECTPMMHAKLVRQIASAIAAEREKAWNEAIMFVNIADIGDAKGADATYKIGKMLEVAAGDKE